MTDGGSRGQTAAEPDDHQQTPVAELGYAAASAELDEIIAELDAGMIDVDVLEVRFRRAIEIVEELDRRIRGARERVGALAPRLEAIGVEEARGTSD